MLTACDDLPLHQTQWPIDRVATTDRNFYDRYYFNVHDVGCETFLALGFGVYPNLGVMDAFACGVRGTRHHIVRASRTLDGDRHETAVGPIRVDVIEGLRRLRIACDAPEHSLSFDLTFEAWAEAHEEPHFFLRNQLGRVVMDYTRLTQLGRPRGWIRIGDERFSVDPDGWRSARDRSWGIRAVGEPEPEGALVDRPERMQFFWNWSPVHFDDCAALYTVSEYEDGRRWHQSGARLMPGEALAAIGVEHRLRFEPGTRRFDGATIRLDFGAGRAMELEYTPKLRFLMPAIGYRGPWSHGQYQGELKVEGDVWDAADQATAVLHGWLTETLCSVRSGDRVGQGIFEMAVIGPSRKYGFEDLFDGWKPDSVR
ncbi:MAG: hypothetical protein HY899_06180 [Deltaproteobacteria bacterium]|nr:hypothetical protein [Deltaproteobacteria bacterium]